MRLATWHLTMLAGAALLAANPAPLQARPAHKRALADHFGPFLSKKLNDCATCHLPDKPGAGRDADDKPHNLFGRRLHAARAELRKAGKTTSLIDRLNAVAGEDSDGDGASNLVELLTGHNPGDPNDRPTAAELAGAETTLAAFRKAQAAYAWRPFEPVQRPAVPRVKNSAWVRNPIDAFIAAEHEKLGLKPRPEAARAVLLRRVYLDLIGLPPTREELHAFLNDTSAGAYEKVVDRLLARPQYGERWGRHWMDVWRYSDWAGYGAQVRDSQPHVWRWRDWIIESLNQDKGYDRMILEMLAGDELAPEDEGALRGTGYLVRNYKLLSREKWMQDTVEHTFLAFQGVTLGCARCHDHMFDPLLQREYYQVRAVFEPYQVRTDRIPGQADTKKDGLVRVYDADPAVPTYLFLRGDDRTPDRSKTMPPAVPEALGGKAFQVEPIRLPLGAVAPDKREFVVKDTIAASAAALVQAQEKLAKAGKGDGQTLAKADLELATARHAALLAMLAAEQMEDAGKKDTPEWKAAASAAGSAQRRAALLEARRNLRTAEQALTQTQAGKKAAAEKARAAAAAALAAAEVALKQPAPYAYTRQAVKTYPETSTGRRLALARWLADKDNPLTARVAVNHVWLRHFGQAIVPTVFDFGRNGRPPSHPALLDWLAAEFMERDWHMKELHHLIVTSNAYRMASTPDPASAAIDHDNRYLWRMAPRRAEAEVVRDLVFFVAGKLDLTMGGPDIDYPLGLTVPRRSLYFRSAAEKQMEFLNIFDGPSVTECYERKHSVVPQQALALANSELTRRHSRLLARQLADKAADAGAFTTLAFEQVLSRPPTQAELAECNNFLRQQTDLGRASKQGPAAANVADGSAPSPDPALRAKELLVHVLMNHHEFVTIR